ncbi:MAG: FtsQ-type POTRA domain-containing protein, partial [Myxococcales bacterium]|nr:FtsQ-type POTRA domain-containing protein [Myxococcales bacterium]
TVPRRTVVACGRTLRRSLPTLLALAAAGAVGTGLWAGYRFVTTSPRFAVTSIEVTGTHELSADEIRARIPLALGENVFRADLDAVEARLEAEPWIADADVSRHLPHTISIAITERTAAAVVDLGGLYLAGADGVPFKRARLDRGEGAGLPVVTGLDRDTFRADPTAAAARVRHALATLATWTADGHRPAIGEIRIDARHDTTLFTYDDAVAIRLGAADGDRLTAKLATFDAAWAALSPDERHQARAIHLDHDTRPDHVTVAFARQAPPRNP